MDMTMNQFIGFMVILGIFCLVMFPIILRANRKLTAEQRAAHRAAADRDFYFSGNDGPRDRSDGPAADGGGGGD